VDISRNTKTEGGGEILHYGVREKIEPRNMKKASEELKKDSRLEGAGDGSMLKITAPKRGKRVRKNGAVQLRKEHKNVFSRQNRKGTVIVRLIRSQTRAQRRGIERGDGLETNQLPSKNCFKGTCDEPQTRRVREIFRRNAIREND